MKLFYKTLLALFICALLVIFSYFFIDRSVATFFYQHKPVSPYIFKWITKIDSLLVGIAPIVIIVFALKAVHGKLSNLCQKTTFAIFVNLVVVVSIKNFLKFVFGRYWPTTWTHNNPSWINTHSYGFHPFHFGVAYMSFPSGHTTAIFAIMSMVWLVYPKWRWLSVISCGAVIISLLVLNYHFAGDIIAGAFLGSISGVYATKLFNLGFNKN